MKLHSSAFLARSLSLAVLALATRGIAAEFIPIIDPRTTGFAARPMAVSNNGIVAGESFVPGFREKGEPFRWDQNDGFQYLGRVPGTSDADNGFGQAYGISANGTTLLGFAGIRGSRGPDIPFTWTEEDGYSDISALGIPRFISDDGNFIAGFERVSDDIAEAVIWGPDGAIRLGELDGSPVASVAHISADANVVVGGPGWYWTQPAGVQALPAPDDSEQIWVEAVAADGSTIVGWSHSDDGHRSAIAWKSDEASRFETPRIEVLPFDSQVVGDVWTEAFLVSSDGSLVFGRSRESPPRCPACETVVWVDGQEPIAFEDWLVGEHDLGDQIAGWDFDSFMPFTQTVSTFGDISSNDRYLVGQALNPDGEQTAFMIDFGGLVGDFNDSGLLDAADINLLTDQVVQGNHPIDYDLDGDGLVNQEDRRVWIEDLANTYFGDANLDQAVGFDDFLELSSGFGEPGDWGNGDFDGSGDVAFPDFLLLSQNFGNSSVAAATVPEPGAMTILSSMWLLALIRRRARR